MLASGLRTTGSGASGYFGSSFFQDLEAVTRSVRDSTSVRLSVTSFCPDQPNGESYRAPAVAFASLPEQRWFLVGVFATQLVAQAVYQHRRVMHPRSPIVLAGVLGSSWSVVHPGFALLALALYREAVEDAEVPEGVGQMTRVAIGELGSQLVPLQLGEVQAMREALEPDRLPQSLAPFVPHGESYFYLPDLEAYHRWCGAAAESILRPKA